MWLHGTIFAGLLLILAGSRMGWLQKFEGMDARSFRLFWIAAFAGNLLGSGLTAKEYMEPDETFTKLAREEGKAYKQELSVEVDGSEVRTVRILVPGKEIYASEETDTEQDGNAFERSAERQIEDKVTLYNQEKNDPDYYYLPDQLDGKSYSWKSRKDSSGKTISGLFLAGGLLILVLGGREAGRKEQERQEKMLLEYPPVIMKFTLLIQAGMSIRRAFQKMASDYASEKKRGKGAPGKKRKTREKTSLAGEEILMVVHELESGVSESEAYRHLGERCGGIRYRTFSTLLVQNLQKGGRSLGDILERESVDAWEERKQKARVMGETASTRLLFPMMLMLLIVMGVIMIPAFLSF